MEHRRESEHGEILLRLDTMSTKLEEVRMAISRLQALEERQTKWGDSAEIRVRDIEHFVHKSRAVNALLAFVISAAVALIPLFIKETP